MQERAEMSYTRQAGPDPYLVLGSGTSRAEQVRRRILWFGVFASSQHYTV